MSVYFAMLQNRHFLVIMFSLALLLAVIYGSTQSLVQLSSLNLGVHQIVAEGGVITPPPSFL